MASYFLTGPIVADGSERFYLTAYIGKQFYVLNSWQSSSQPLVYYLDPSYISPQGEPTRYSPVVFTALAKDGGFLLTDVTVQPNPIYGVNRSNHVVGGLGEIPYSEPPVASYLLGPEVIQFVATVAPWSSSTLLAGVPYSLQSAGLQVFFFFGAQPPSYTGGYSTSSAPLTPGINIFLVPETWYANTAASHCQALGNSLQAAFCTTGYLSVGVTACSELPATGGWTTPEECDAGIQFAYCPTGYACGSVIGGTGTPGCNGPCTNNGICVYRDGSYVCRLTSGTTEGVVILIVVIMGLVLAAVVIGLSIWGYYRS